MPHLIYNKKQELLEHPYPEDAGSLNFLITVMMQRYWSKSKKNYEALNAISGAATEALAEFRRKVIVPYEIEKEKSNGSAYAD